MKRFVLACLPVLLALAAFSQTVPFPPNPGNTGQLENWGYQQVGTNWDTSPFLPFIYNGIDFRLMPPNGVTYTASTKTWNFSEPGKKYPLLIFFNGAGEDGHDNNNQLRHGGKEHRDAVKNGKFPGFLFYPQSVTHDQAKNIVEKLIQVLPIDVNRIYVHGLSKGGGLTWQFLISYPTLVAGAFPMSAANDAAKTQNLLYNSIRQVQGGKDTNPAPWWTQTIVDWFNTNGGHLEYIYLPNEGHGTWSAMYARADFFPWFLQQKKNKILVRFDRNELCPGAPISVDMGFTPGFEAYEWYLNGTRIQGANSHKLIATQYGTYTGRIRNRGVWYDADPVEVKQKAPTYTPPIQVNGLNSIVLPAPDGSTTTELQLPEGYTSYTWRNAANQVVSTQRVFTTATVGTYTATVQELNGCTSVASPVFTVINANGPNNPEAISNLVGYATTESDVLLSWTDKPSPAYNETGFEVYRSTSATGSYELVGITAADAIQFADHGLKPNTTYFYKIRPVNQHSAGPVSEPVPVLTKVDNILPTAPGNLRITGISQSSVSLDWDASTDNIGVYRYDIYRDNVRVLSTSTSDATIYNLTEGQFYRFHVRARDVTGNLSAESNIVTATAVKQAFEYKYYEAASTFGPNLPNFNNLTPVATGSSNTLDISVRRRNTHFAFMWTGQIHIPVAGNYTFALTSTDGSKLYIGSYSETDRVIDNDGSHTSRERTGTKNFTQPGWYPIIITYYNGTRTPGIQQLSWQNTAHGTVAKAQIPVSQFVVATPAPGATPVPPSNLTATTASYNQINLSWTDNSNNESGFRIYRAESNTGTFISVGSTAANTTTFQDKGLAPSKRYYYRVTAFNANGESDFSAGVPRGLAYSYYEAPNMTSLSQINNLTPKTTGKSNFFDVNLRERNQNFAIKWVGKINITTQATYTFYTSSDDGSTLLIDGVQVVSNDFDQSQRERSGTRSLTVGWHDIEVRWRKRTTSNSRLTVAYSRSGMSKTTIAATQAQSLFFGTEVNAMTQALPAAPAAPTNVQVAKPTNTSFRITWQDNATNETSYEILRSYQTSNNYVVYKQLPANSTSFLDEGLFSNATYFYKVQVTGPGGTRVSSQVSGTTSNNPPVLTDIVDQTLKFGKVLDVPVYAEDLDNDAITLSVSNLPSFATFSNHGDGTGNIRFQPLQAHLGNYNITVTASDPNGGSHQDSFVFTVTDKDVPQISNIPAVSVNEAQSTSFMISATSDFGTQNLQWSFSGLPSFATYSITNGVVQVFVQPGYIHSGTYPVDVTVTDQANASATKSFVITVVDVDPNQKIYANLVHSTNGPSPWNNITGRLTNNLVDNKGANSGIGVEFLTTAWNVHYDGATTGNNSGAFPDNVLKDYYYFGIFGAPETVDVRLSGLDPARTYKLSFMASSVWTGVADNGTTEFVINGNVVSLPVQGNTQNLATFNSVTPAANGTVTVTMRKAAGTQVGYLNGFTIESIYQDATPPAAPRDVKATLANNQVVVSWVDAPFNETGFDVYRSQTENGTYVKINSTPVAANSTSFNDNNLIDGATFFYKLKAVNSYGESPFSNVASIQIPDIAPQVNITGNLEVAPNATSVISATTSPGATLTVQGLPSFATVTTVNASSINITFQPNASHTGTHNFTITATEGGQSTVAPVTVTVSENILYRIMVNFTQNSAAPAPWNNTSKAPAVNDTFSNLRDQNNNTTGVSLTLVSAFGGVHNEGAVTGNNSGAVPDNVLREYYWFGVFNAPNTVTMRVSGLSAANKYRFKFLGSSVFTNNGTITNNGSTTFTIGTKSASVNVQGNTSNFAIIEDVITNAQGQVTIVASKGANAAAGYVNAVIIEALPVDPSEFAPSDLSAAGYSQNQITLRWSDNSPMETGYQVYRSATGAEGSYSLIATLPADANTHIDNVPSRTTLYHYRVRATTAQGPSDYTNVARSSAIAFRVLVNVAGSATYDAPAPWNNLSRFGFENDVFVGFKDESGLPTGLRMRVQTPLEGDNDWGMTTNNNSGIFPDKVLKSFWFNDAYFPQGEFIIEGLDQTFSYNFGFMGSIDVTSAVNTDFTINGVTVTNRNDRNISNVSYIRNVKPDSNSEVLFTVRESAGSPWSIFNAFVIEGFATGGDESASGRAKTSAGYKDGNIRQVRFGEAANTFTFFPNPVKEKMNVRINDASFGKVRYEFIDLMGRVVQEGVVANDQLDSEFTVDVQVPSAVYLIKITYPNGAFDVRKFVKE